MKIMTKNPTLKIISLILAIILWLFVKSKSEGEVGLVVPLEFVHIPSNLIITRVSEDAINVRIMGPLSQLDRFPSREGRARIDLSDARYGMNTFDILPENFNLPQALRITQISPSSIKVELDRLMDKIVHVKAVVQGEPARGYRVVKIAVEPPYLNLQGARSQLEDLTEVLTEEVNISGLKETLEVAVPLRLADLRLKEGVKGTVQVIVTVKEERKRR
jgi:YbbR domain-containing protein